MGVREAVVASQPTPDSMRNAVFTRVKRGYDQREVAEYLCHVADQVDAIEGHIHELEADLRNAHRRAATRSAGSDYAAMSERLTELLRSFDEDVERRRKAAESEVENTVAAARADADRIRLDAQSTAEELRARGQRIIQQAEIQTKGILDELRARRATILDDMRLIRDRLRDTTDDLHSFLEGMESESSSESMTEDLADLELANLGDPLPDPG
jgi:DivIVA domain-containing protein